MVAMWFVPSPIRRIRAKVPGLKSAARRCAALYCLQPDLSKGHCIPGLVAGHYQPLADDIPLRKRPTKPAFCSRFRKRSKTDCHHPLCFDL